MMWGYSGYETERPGVSIPRSLIRADAKMQTDAVLLQTENSASSSVQAFWSVFQSTTKDCSSPCTVSKASGGGISQVHLTWSIIRRAHVKLKLIFFIVKSTTPDGGKRVLMGRRRKTNRLLVRRVRQGLPKGSIRWHERFYLTRHSL